MNAPALSPGRFAVRSRPTAAAPCRVLVLYDPRSLATNFVRDHLSSFGEFLPHDVWYLAATHDLPLRIDLASFDVIVVHFCVRVALGDHLSAPFAEALRQFPGLKILFVQDEYDSPWVVSRWVRETGVRVVFTCVPEADRETFYPRSLIGPVRFESNLTGYVSSRLTAWPAPRPIAERPIVVGYRGRELPFRYGHLAREKLVIGQRMKALCTRAEVVHDIEWTEGARLEGDAWFRFLEECRCMLGTESGSNVVDPDGELARRMGANPLPDYANAHRAYLADRDGLVHMNQIAPKMFEAIALRTALVLFEGEYSGVIEPDRHFIPVRKDFGNVDDVFHRLADVHGLQAMADRAYLDVIASGRYGYATLADRVARVIDECGWRQTTEGCGRVATGRRPRLEWPHREPMRQIVTDRPPLLRGRWRERWLGLPAWARWLLRRTVKPFLKGIAQRAVPRQADNSR